jgi:two-component system, OmpR family, phosphate regulon sensor histidine kinase PhoR
VTGRIFFRLLTAFALVILVSTLILYFLLNPAWQRASAQEAERNLRQKALMFAQRVDADRQGSLQTIAALQGQAAGARATIIDVNGKVLADSEAEPSSMGDVSDRAEFAAALHGQVAVATRSGNRVGVPVLFIAVPIQGGAVRLAYPLADAESSTRELPRQLGLAAVVALLLSVPLAFFAAPFITRRSNHPLENAGKTTDGDLTVRKTEPLNEDVTAVTALDTTGHPAPVEDAFAELQRNQRQLETLLNSMQDAVIAVDPEGRVQWANQGMQELTQRVRLQSPLVETVRDPEFLQAMKEAAETRTVRSARAISIVSGKTFDVTAAPLPDGGAVAVLRDLTERDLLEKTRRDFIANVSHELRTPLTSIQGYSETLLDTIPQDSSQREFLEIIRKNAARMSRLTEDLLALARVESGEKRFDLEPVKPEELLRDAAQNFAETANGRGLQLEVKDEASEPVLADRDAIHHVFGNLLENAVKYGGSGTRVVLGARALEDSVEFYVRDFGQGIPSEHLARLFERFYRVDKARSRESGGTGLGLSIAKHIVLAHGGAIRAESELNHGATFLFTLPLASEEEISEHA